MDKLQEAELSIIGGVLQDSDKALPLVIDILSPKHFYTPTLAQAYKTALELSYEQKPIDFITVINKLVGMGYQEKDAKVVLAQAMEAHLGLSNIQAYAKIVVKCYRARELEMHIHSLIQGGIRSDTVDEVLDQLSGKLEELMKNRGDSSLMAIQDIALDLYYEIYNEERKKQKINTGFGNVDHILDGMYPGNLVLLGARPGVGKTALALNIMSNIAAAGKRIAFYSLEMSRMEIFERLVASKSNVSLKDIKNRNVNNYSNEIARSTDFIYQMPFLINDNGRITVNTIRNQCRMKDIDIIIIDYLQLMRPTGRHPNRYEEVGQISRDLKGLAKELNVTIVALVQLNRVSKESEEPNPSDLRDSGQLEQDADCIMMLWKLEDDKVGCKIAKNRNGITGRAALGFHADKMQFYSTTYNFKAVQNRRREPWSD